MNKMVDINRNIIYYFLLIYFMIDFICIIIMVVVKFYEVMWLKRERERWFYRSIMIRMRERDSENERDGWIDVEIII